MKSYRSNCLKRIYVLQINTQISKLSLSNEHRDQVRMEEDLTNDLKNISISATKESNFLFLQVRNAYQRNLSSLFWIGWTSKTQKSTRRGGQILMDNKLKSLNSLQ